MSDPFSRDTRHVAKGYGGSITCGTIFKRDVARHIVNMHKSKSLAPIPHATSLPHMRDVAEKRRTKARRRGAAAASRAPNGVTIYDVKERKSLPQTTAIVNNLGTSGTRRDSLAERMDTSPTVCSNNAELASKNPILLTPTTHLDYSRTALREGIHQVNQVVMSEPSPSPRKHIVESLESSIALKQEILANETLVAEVARVAEVIVECFRRGNRVLLAGNGGSAADAQHIAAEFVGRFSHERPGLPSIALSADTSMLTAIGNDYGFEKLFARQIEANGKTGDVFVALTTSGNSSNILEAITVAKRLGITTVGFTGAGGAIQGMCDWVIKVPSTSTPRIQEAHITIAHAICEWVENTLFPCT